MKYLLAIFLIFIGCSKEITKDYVGRCYLYNNDVWMVIAQDTTTVVSENIQYPGNKRLTVVIHNDSPLGNEISCEMVKEYLK
jgi:hypothetical protein